MGCKHSRDATLVYRAKRVAIPLRPSTPSFHVQQKKVWSPASSSQTNEVREELPSFVVSDSAGLVGSSDGEPVHGMMSAFTFSFIQASDTNSNNSSLGSISFTSVEQTSPESSEPPESLAFAMTGDSIELMVIPEERLGRLRDGFEVSSGTTQQESAEPSTNDRGATEPEEEKSPSNPLTHVTMSELAVTESSESLTYELDAFGISYRSIDNRYNTIETRRSVELSEGDYMVTEMEAAFRRKSAVETVQATLSDESSHRVIECQSIQEVAAAVVQDIIAAALSDTSKLLIDEDRRQSRDCKALVASSSLQVEPSSTTTTKLSMKTEQPENAQESSFRVPIYSIVNTSTKNGVVMYHVQLLDEFTDSAKWVTPLLFRYSDFSEMYLKLKETKVPAIDKVPKLPGAGVVHFARGRKSKKTIQERQEQFSNVLRYIAEHQELHDSAVFQNFLAK
ncbi:unnamed protein product [Peronospora belbahrii]|uniref:PX domain-containing protein n=1 Tax=Peronospora belbahrii TaxID=622444 RepID=A0ABN8DB20_9STRA|nr:unnamed protein product [Peronospora belbahrii]